MVHVPGFHFLDKTRVQHLYIAYLSLAEIIFSFVWFIKIVTRIILQGKFIALFEQILCVVHSITDNEWWWHISYFFQPDQGYRNYGLQRKRILSMCNVKSKKWDRNILLWNFWESTEYFTLAARFLWRFHAFKADTVWDSSHADPRKLDTCPHVPMCSSGKHGLTNEN